MTKFGAVEGGLPVRGAAERPARCCRPARSCRSGGWRSGPSAASARRLAADAADLGLGHAGIMFELQRRQLAALVAAEAGEGDDGADVARPPVPSGAPPRRRGRNPPPGRATTGLDGGRPCASAARHRREQRDLARAGDRLVVSTCSWLSATRMTSGHAARLIFLAQASSARFSRSRRSSRLAGRSISSSPLPIRSRTQAK
jgi:hypothetical protein